MRFHPPVGNHQVMEWEPALYTIRVNGQLGDMVLSAFPGMTPQRKGTHTVLTGWLDQSALYGVLAQMEALGLALLEVRQVEPHERSLESRDTRSPGPVHP
jgi:hypothetical protein